MDGAEPLQMSHATLRQHLDAMRIATTVTRGRIELASRRIAAGAAPETVRRDPRLSLEAVERMLTAIEALEAMSMPSQQPD